MKNPLEFSVYVEMPAGSDPIKYEVKDHHFFVKRILLTELKYPTNYGYIPKTLAEDGDELDALIITPYPLKQRSHIRCRAIGVLDVDDQEGKDYKIIAIPTTKVFLGYRDWENLTDLPPHTQTEIEYFFTNYKNEDPRRWSTVSGWLGAKQASKIIRRAGKRFFEINA